MPSNPDREMRAALAGLKVTVGIIALCVALPLAAWTLPVMGEWLLDHTPRVMGKR